MRLPLQASGSFVWRKLLTSACRRLGRPSRACWAYGSRRVGVSTWSRSAPPSSSVSVKSDALALVSVCAADVPRSLTGDSGALSGGRWVCLWRKSC